MYKLANFSVRHSTTWPEPASKLNKMYNYIGFIKTAKIAMKLALEQYCLGLDVD